MDCPKVQEWLLRSDLSPAEAAPPDVADHLARCGQCRALADRLRRLEQAAREMPRPEGGQAARQAVLSELRQRAARRPSRFLSRRRLLEWGLAAAALVLLAWGVGTLVLGPGGAQTAEGAAVLDRLVDWNIELAETESACDRQQLYSARADDLGQMARQDRLSPEEHELADSLLANGARLIRQDDPLAEAEGFTDVEAVLVQNLDAAIAKGDASSMQRLGRYYSRVVQHGINAKVAKANPVGTVSIEGDRRLERILRRHGELRDRVAAMLEKSPDLSSADIRRALDLPPKKHAKD